MGKWSSSRRCMLLVHIHIFLSKWNEGTTKPKQHGTRIRHAYTYIYHINVSLFIFSSAFHHLTALSPRSNQDRDRIISLIVIPFFFKRMVQWINGHNINSVDDELDLVQCDDHHSIFSYMHLYAVAQPSVLYVKMCLCDELGDNILRHELFAVSRSRSILL